MKNIHLIPTDKPSRLFLKENTLLLNNQYTLQKIFTKGKCQNIYITSDLEVKEGDLKVGEYYLYFNKIRQFKEIDNLNRAWKDYKKIILTTDQDLIANGVQAIDDEFLEWFVKNPSCEWVEVIYDKDAFPYGVETAKGYGWYKIIILQEELKQECLHQESRFRDYYKDGCYKCWECGKIVVEEPKQETLEEAANKIYPNDGYDDETYCDFGELCRDKWLEGAKWVQEKMYSEAIEFAEWIRIKDFQTTSKNNWIGLDMKYYTTQELFEKFKKK
jgi:hypothetical protein